MTAQLTANLCMLGIVVTNTTTVTSTLQPTASVQIPGGHAAADSSVDDGNVNSVQQHQPG